eukprot:CAMPEP_0114614874 /NCGR_PEP_ID=MMETSP0168-20121206/5877_1 /TAXON_ID=95228 ORGANISM="Vannella sp., Strain DIVA3 517/6/12" /NCGR_SAMPLE_ID=MMETSP0168 /ASSEMBLY_ACC=CAM_ASM_000044 /LENGTH=454 /DNA_ID=CAMNT_0001825933 /DNA_START=103 /DNA_END=1467 /DNA_ORIENTATION=+
MGEKNRRGGRRLPKWIKCSTVAPACCLLLMLLLLYEFTVVKGPEWNSGRRPPPKNNNDGGGGGAVAITPPPRPYANAAEESSEGEAEQRKAIPMYEYELDLNEYRLAVEYYETLSGEPRRLPDEQPRLAPGAFRVPGFAQCVRTAELVLGSRDFCHRAWTSVLRMGRVDMVADTILLVPDRSDETNTLLVLQDPRKPVLELEGLECGQCGLVLKAELAPFVAVAIDRVLEFYRVSPISMREVDLPWVEDSLAALLSVEPDLDVTASRHTSSLALTWRQYVDELACQLRGGEDCLAELGVAEWSTLAVFDYLMGNKHRSDADGCASKSVERACTRRFDNVFWTMEDRRRLVLINNFGEFSAVEEANHWIDGIQRWPSSLVDLLESWEDKDFGTTVVDYIETEYPLVWSEMLCERCAHSPHHLAQVLESRLQRLLTTLRTRRDSFMLRIVPDADLE